MIQTDHPRIDPQLLNKSIVDEQIAKFRAAVRRDANDETAHYGLGVAYFNLGLLEEAADELTEAARRMPENPHIQCQLAVVLADLATKGRRGADEAAWDRVNRALLLQPKHVEALLLKAELQLRKQELSDAIETMRVALAEQPNEVRPKLVSALLSKAAAHLGNRQWLRAVEAWRDVALERPDAVREPIAMFLNAHSHLVPALARPQASDVSKSHAERASEPFWTKWKRERNERIADSTEILAGQIPDVMRLITAAERVAADLYRSDQLEAARRARSLHVPEPGSLWESCEITARKLEEDGRRARWQFSAEARGPRGPYRAGESQTFWSSYLYPRRTQDGNDALNDLFDRLVTDGWVHAVGGPFPEPPVVRRFDRWVHAVGGPSWYSHRFGRLAR